MANESGKSSEVDGAGLRSPQLHISSRSNRLTPSEITELRENKRRSVAAALKAQAEISKKNRTLLERDDESKDF